MRTIRRRCRWPAVTPGVIASLGLLAAAPGAGGSATFQACGLTGSTAALGTYVTDEGRSYLVTPGGWGGLNLIDDGDYRLGRLEPISATAAAWRALDGTPLGSLVANEDDARGCRLELQSGDGTVEMLPAAPQPYRQEAVKIPGDVQLAGTVFLPVVQTPTPGVVLIHGSDDSDRDNIWYVSVSESLARRGIAVLLPDKRGSGQSGGDWRTVGFEALGRDSAAAAEFLAAYPEVEDAGVGFLSLSQGGWIAPLAAEDADAAFAVTVSGSAVPLWQQQIHYLDAVARGSGLPDELVAQILDTYRAGLRYIRSGNGWAEYESARTSLLAGPAAPLAQAFPDRRDDWSLEWGRQVVDFDPVPAWQTADVPLLAIFGQTDVNVPVQASVDRLREELECGTTPRCRLVVYEGSGHGILEPGGRRPRADFLDLVAGWIHAQTP